jgi:carboxymethylenebutenolidase
MPEVIITEEVKFDVAGKQTTGYLARPENPGPHPSVVVIQEWYGIDPHIKDVTERFARLGFATIAPDLYHGRVGTTPAEGMQLVQSLDFEKAGKEIDIAADWLGAQSFTRESRFGIVGYCLGGGLALTTAIRNPNVAASVVYYGGLPDRLENLREIRCPILGLYGDDEADRAGKLLDLLTQYQKPGEVHVYDGARHGFFNDTGVVYNPAAAYDTWPRVIELFKRHLA